jgi:hypothetical protein
MGGNLNDRKKLFLAEKSFFLTEKQIFALNNFKLVNPG